MKFPKDYMKLYVAVAFPATRATLKKGGSQTYSKNPRSFFDPDTTEPPELISTAKEPTSSKPRSGPQPLPALLAPPLSGQAPFFFCCYVFGWFRGPAARCPSSPDHTWRDPVRGWRP